MMCEAFLPRAIVLDIDVLKPSRLTTDVAIERALSKLVVRAKNVDGDSLVDNLLSQPLLLEFVLAGKHT